MATLCVCFVTVHKPIDLVRTHPETFIDTVPRIYNSQRLPYMSEAWPISAHNRSQWALLRAGTKNWFENQLSLLVLINNPFPNIQWLRNRSATMDFGSPER